MVRGRCRTAELVSFGVQILTAKAGYPMRAAWPRWDTSSLPSRTKSISRSVRLAPTPTQRCAFLPGAARSSGSQGGARRRNQRYLSRRRHPRWGPRADQESATPPGALDLSEAIEEVISSYEPSCLSKHVLVQPRLTQGLPLVPGDRVQPQRPC